MHKSDRTGCRTNHCLSAGNNQNHLSEILSQRGSRFFSELHSFENIRKDVEDGRVGILKSDNEIVGTGCFKENHITRVYVKPSAQRKGYRSYIMECLEKEICLQHDTVNLDASLPASCLYEKRGYKTVKHERWNVANGVVLVYEIMEKRL